MTASKTAERQEQPDEANDRRDNRTWAIAGGVIAVFRLLYRLNAALARLAVRSGRSKDPEIIVLRHQLRLLLRQVDRPRPTTTTGPCSERSPRLSPADCATARS